MFSCKVWGILVLLFLVCPAAVAQTEREYSVESYIVQKKKDCPSSLQFRLRVYGYEFKEPTRIGEGIDVLLGDSWINKSETLFPFITGVKAWEVVDCGEKVVTQFDAFEGRFYKEVNKIVCDEFKSSNGVVTRRTEVGIERLISQKYTSMCRDAFDLFTPEQIDGWYRYQFQLSFLHNARSCLEQAMDREDVKDIDEDELDAIETIDNLFQKQIRNAIKSKVLSKTEKYQQKHNAVVQVLTEEQLGRLKQLIGASR